MDDGAKRKQEEQLARLADLSVAIAGEDGRLLHMLHRAVVFPGTGLFLQEAPADEPVVPPWPGDGETDPLDDDLGERARQTTAITQEELDEMEGASDAPDGTDPDPDLTGPGSFGSEQPSLPSERWPGRRIWRRDGRAWRAAGQEDEDFPPCDKIWIFQFSEGEHVDSCQNLNFKRFYDATLLRALAYATLYCRRHWPEDCSNARIWILGANWMCFERATALQPNPRPFVEVSFNLAVACVDA